MIRSFPAGLIAAAAFAFVAPLAASAKGYQPSMVDSTAIEGQFLIAGAGSKKECEAKGKRWLPRDGAPQGIRKNDYCATGHSTAKYCSCQK